MPFAITVDTGGTFSDLVLADEDRVIGLYKAPTTAFDQMKKASPEQQKAGMDAWMSWGKKAASAIVDMGAPLGKSLRVAIDLGFSEALRAIIDTHATTMIAALFLFQFGTGPVKGFAVTLTIGIAASLLTAVFVTRTFFLMWFKPPTALLRQP